jgi:hypothetical protein
MKRKKVIKELNVVFKKRGWLPLPEVNYYKGNTGKDSWYGEVLIEMDGVASGFLSLYLNRTWFHYSNTKLKGFTLAELDGYAVEFIKPICKKYKINQVIFGSLEEEVWLSNLINMDH